MQEIRIDKTELERLIDRLDAAPEVLREARRAAMEAAAPKLKQAVDAQIGGSGKVRGWQGQYVGSKGGYAAVRAKAKTYTEPTKGGNRYAVGYVTNAVNSGHRFPSTKLGYRTSAGVVPGRQYYQRAQGQVEAVAQEATRRVVDALTEHLEG